MYIDIKKMFSYRRIGHLIEYIKDTETYVARREV
jgi:hypothetical protein